MLNEFYKIKIMYRIQNIEILITANLLRKLCEQQTSKSVLPVENFGNYFKIYSFSLGFHNTFLLSCLCQILVAFSG